jgi:hypothetical protein
MTRWRLSLAAAAALALAAVAADTPVPPLRAAEPACQVETAERIVAIGDVHGAYDRLVEILRTTGLLDERLRWAGGRAHLVQLGDVVDRGPDSRKALDLLDRLQDEARRAGGAAHLLLGNHEVMRMLGDLRYVVPGEYEAFATARSTQLRERYVESAGPAFREKLLKETPLGLLEMRVAFGRSGQYGDSLRKHDVVVRINGIVFLHGGISPAVAGMSCDAINTTVRQELTDIDKTRTAPLKSLAAREDGPLWYRGLALEPDSFAPSVDDILMKQHAHAIVVGHTVVPDGRILPRFGGKVIQIDTGMQPAYVATGRASALEIERGVFTAIYSDRRDVLSGPPVETAAPAPALQ